MRKKGQSIDLATKQFQEGYKLLMNHPMFTPLASHAHFNRQEGNLCPEEGYAVVTKDGSIHVHPKKRATAEEWLYILAHCLLHLGFEHFKETENPALWNMACDVFVAKFLYDMKLGKIPGGYLPPVDMMTRDEETLYNQFLQNGVDSRYTGWSVGGTKHSDMIFLEEGFRWGGKVEWGDLLGRGIVQAVSSAIDVVSGHAESLGESKGRLTEAQRANNWFLDSYPLLGSLAADFALIEDSILCKRLDISIAAIDIVHKEIYINPAAGLSYEECKFVLAHEYLHAGALSS